MSNTALDSQKPTGPGETQVQIPKPVTSAKGKIFNLKK